MGQSDIFISVRENFQNKTRELLPNLNFSKKHTILQRLKKRTALAMKTAKIC